MQLPLFLPESDWREPTSLPDIPAGVPIAVDTETRDEGIQREQGSSWAWKDGCIAGVSIAWGNSSTYLPIRHPDSHCFDAGHVAGWLHDRMRAASVVVFHNATYDLGWLTTWDFDPDDYTLADTHAMAVLLDENRFSYSLDALCRVYGLEGKDERKLKEAGAAYGLKNVKGEMYKMPARYVGGYAARDALATLELYRTLSPLIDEQSLRDALQLEIDLIPCCLKMRQRGILLNMDYAVQVQESLAATQKEVLDELRRIAPANCEPRTGDELRSAKFLERLFDALGIPYSRTAKTGQGQFLSKVLSKSEHPIPRSIAKWRQLEDLRDKFIGTYILGNSRRGRIHAEIHQLRDDDGGTRSYRFSYANPPLQQMPAKDEGLAPLIRGIFLPEDGDLWLSADYSQQEPRLAVHFAALAGLPGHEGAVEYYGSNPKADFHTMVAEITGLPRGQAKIINLGVMYGMGKDKLAASLGVSVDEAVAILAQYNERMPFVKELAEFCMRRADSRGFIRLLDGARCRWDRWQVGKQSPLSYDEARTRQRNGDPAWQGQLRRAFTHKAMNRLAQGSAARQTKMAMRMAYQEGILPLLQMHDEIDFNITSEEQGQRATEIMRSVVPLKIPVYVDEEYGRSWGESMKKYTYAEARALAPLNQAA